MPLHVIVLPAISAIPGSITQGRDPYNVIKSISGSARLARYCVINRVARLLSISGLNTFLRNAHADTGQCTLRPVDCSPLHPTLPTITLSSTNKLALALMSHPHSTVAPSSTSNFQIIFNNALDTYKNRTRNDLRAHPLAVQLQTCNSPSAIIAVLQEKVQGLDQSLSTDERWTKWLGPTVNVLYSFSTILGASVSLVCFMSCTCLRSALSCLCGRHSHLRV